MVAMETSVHSPLRSPLRAPGSRKWAIDYSVNGYKSALVMDNIEGNYRTNNAVTTFADMVTFSRASGATYTDSSGVLQTAASGVARTAHHIYNGTSWVKAGLLVEPTAATNLVTHSNDFSNAFWSKDRASVGASDASGILTLTSIKETAVPGLHEIYPLSGIVLTAAAYTWSIYLKADGRNYCRVSLATASLALGASVVVNLSAGTIGAVTNHGAHTGGTATIENVDDGIYRVSITITGTAATYYPGATFSTDGTTFSYAGDTGLGVKVGGAQLEPGSVSSSYIPTAGSTATRAAETVTIAAAKVPYSATALWIQMEGYMTYADNDSTLAAVAVAGEATLFSWNLDNSNYIAANLHTGSTRTGSVHFRQEASGVADEVEDFNAYSPGINVAFNIASRHGSTFINGAVDGTALTANTTPVSLPALSSTNLQLGFTGNAPFIISKFRMGTGDIGNAGIEEAST